MNKIWIAIVLIAKVVSLSEFNATSLTSLQGKRLKRVDTYFDGVSSGDVNGDGVPDMILQSSLTTYIVYGKRGQLTDTDLISFNASQGFTVNLISAFSAQYGAEVQHIGDLNGDGLGDIIIFDRSEYLCNDGPISTLEAYVIYGKRTGAVNITISPTFTLSNGQGFKITNRECFSQLSASYGDVNGDGLDDLVLGGNTTHYIIFGKRGNLPNINLVTLASPAGFKIKCNSPFRPYIMTIGDVNADGAEDIFIGPASNLWVVFGRKSDSSDINLSTLTSAQGFKIVGSSWTSANKIGDINGDGVSDFFISPFVIYGRKGWVSQINLTSLQASEGFQITGSYFNFCVGLGDVNRDGIEDVALGSPSYSPYSFEMVPNLYPWLLPKPRGMVLILFGTRSGFPQVVDTRYLDNTQAAQIIGSKDGEYLGTSAALVKDLNGDGINDIIIGASEMAYVIYGGFCARNSQCTNVVSSTCSSSFCSACQYNADCAHLPQAPLCFNRRCVTCKRTSDCSFFPSSYCNNIHKMCLSCPEGCSTCLDPSTCLTCKSGFAPKDFMCVPVGPEASRPPPFVIMIAILMGIFVIIFTIRFIQLKNKKKADTKVNANASVSVNVGINTGNSTII